MKISQGDVIWMQNGLWSRCTAAWSRPLTQLALPPRSVGVRTFPKAFNRNNRLFNNPKLSKPWLRHVYTARSDITPIVALRSRAVTQAVRKELADGNASAALAISNAAIAADKHVSHAPADGFSAVNLKFDVSARLPVHTLIHGLLRAGMPFAASEYVHSRMLEGVRVRSATLNAIVQSLCDAKTGPTERDYAIMGWSTQFASESQVLEAEYPKLSPGTRTAVQVLRVARKTKNSRNNRMYERLINACLLQGEIVVGCMLFALLVRDWQLRCAITTNKRHDAMPHGSPEVDGRPLQKNHIDTARELRLDDLRMQIPRPSTPLLQVILGHISFPGMARYEKLQRRNEHPSDPDIRMMKSGLYHLAELLDGRRLDIQQLASLIAVLSHVPREPRVNVNREYDGLEMNLEVYSYVHSVLGRFSKALPVRFNQLSPETPSMIRPPNIRTYNALLDYQLRHRMNLDVASALLGHMRIERHHPVYPDMVTYNTILRGASRLRRNDIVERLLTQLKESKTNDPLLNLVLATVPSSGPKSKNPWVADGARDIPRHKFEYALAKMGVSDLKLFDAEDMRTSLDKLVADRYTMSSYIAHLASTGQFDRILQFLHALFPELQRQRTRNRHAYRTVHQRLREASQRGVLLGPYFFGTVIAALSRAGKIGLAERVWCLGQMSEEASWSPNQDVNGGMDPWCLDIAAFTAMLQLYAKQAKAGVALERLGKQYVGGWGHFNWLRGTDQAHKYRRRSVSERQRSTAGRELGLQLARSMEARSQLMWKAFRNGDRRKRPHPPQPDARFYNALLDMYGTTPTNHAKRRRALRSQWMSRYNRAIGQHRTYGWRPAAPRNPLLLEIIQNMLRDGYEPPPSLRKSFLGRMLENGATPPPEESAPWRYPPGYAKGFTPHKLPTRKTKGLPIDHHQPSRILRRPDIPSWSSRFQPERDAKQPDEAR